MSSYFNILKWAPPSNSKNDLLETGDAIVTFDSPAPDALLSFEIDDPCPDSLLVENKFPNRDEVVNNPSTLRLLRGGVLGLVLHAATGKPQPPIDLPHVPGLYYKVEDRNVLNHAPGHDDSLELKENRAMRVKIVESQLAYLEDPRGLFFQFLDIIIPSKEQRKAIRFRDEKKGTPLPYLKENVSTLLERSGAEVTLTPPFTLYETTVPNMSDSKESVVYSSYPAPNSKEVQMRKDILTLSAKVFAHDPDPTAFSFLVGLETRSTFVFLEGAIPTSEMKLNGQRFIIRPSFDLALIK